MKDAVILVGHGASPLDFPRDKIARLKRLESERWSRAKAARERLDISPEEKALDSEVRNWPRTPKTDPYQAGLSSLAEKLQAALEKKVVAAHNEFCAPSVEDAAEGLIRDGYSRITLATTMYTRGGVHSETEIPLLVQALRERHPKTEFLYAWPMDERLIVEFLGKVIAGAFRVNGPSGARGA